MESTTTRTNIDRVIEMYDPNGGFSNAIYSWQPGETVDLALEAGAESDPYELLATYAEQILKGTRTKPEGIVLVCRGMARPMLPDGEPAGLETARRCVVFTAATVEGTEAVLHLYDMNGDLVVPESRELVDETSDEKGTAAGGPLAESLDMVGVAIWGTEYAARLFVNSMTHGDTPTGNVYRQRAELAIRGAAIAEQLFGEGETEA